jgi:hypothetical protein
MPVKPFSINIENSIPLFDFSELGIEEAHFELGRGVSTQVQKILSRRIGEIPDETREQIERIAATRLIAIEKIQKSKSTPSLVRDALTLYCGCLESWSLGINLAVHDLHPLTPLEIAFYLQDDQPGCQSGAYRKGDGSVLFWHTEEDVDEPDFVRVDQPRLMRFISPFNNAEIFSFIYPDLLPGPNFNWRDDAIIQFADSLFLREQNEMGISANLVTWVSLVLGPLIPLVELIRALQPIFGGYALFQIFSREGQTECHRVEYAADQLLKTDLGLNPGSHLIQTNAFSDPASKIALRCERNPFASRPHFVERIVRAEDILGRSDPSEIGINQIRRMISSREGGKWAFANRDVKAHLYGRLSVDSIDIHCHPGMALKVVAGL